MSAACPTVSVVVPVHRSSATVEACLDSVAAQTLPAAEVVLVDDRGGDDAVGIGRKVLVGHGVAHRVVTHDRNRGLGAARNSGLAAAGGDWVWFLDSDDVADPRFLADLVGAAQRGGADVAVCRTLRVDPHGRAIRIDEPAWPAAALPGPEAARGLLRNSVRAYACNKVFRRSALPADPFDVGRCYEDFCPMLRLFLRTSTVALVDAPLYRYTVTPGSISGRFGPHTLDLLAVAADVARELRTLGLERRWRADHIHYRCANVVLPIANLALRAEHAAQAGPATAAAVRTARAQVGVTDLLRLAVAGEPRLAATVAALKAAPRWYGRKLASR